jgi:hypothetical protein
MSSIDASTNARTERPIRSVTAATRSRRVYGQRISGLTVGGNELNAGVVNENEVRAAAGITLVAGGVAFSYAYFTHLYIPLQAVASFFFVEFLIRVTAGIQYSPTGIVAHAMTRRHPPQWVSAKPKRFAWTLALVLGFAMTIITNGAIARPYLPRTLCLICLTLMWLETAIGLCLGCEIYGLLVRRGWITKDPEIEICANGVCDVPKRTSLPENTGGGPGGIVSARSTAGTLPSLDFAALTGRHTDA